MPLSRLLSIAALPALFGPLAAQTLIPQPVIRKAVPQMVYPNSPGWLDGFGRIIVYLQGENLAPDDDLGHPTGQEGGYQHIFVRGVSPKGDRTTPWMVANEANGARTLGACAKSLIQLGINPARFLSEPGSHLQVKLWVSRSVTEAEDPSTSTALASTWSPIFTVDVAPAGVQKPLPLPPPLRHPRRPR